MKTIELTSDNFDQTLADTDLPVLVDFHAEWCGPCKMLAPVLEQLAEEKDGEAIIAKVDIDAAKDLATRFEVRSVPTLIVFKNGQPVTATRGAQPKAALAALIDQAAGEAVGS